LHLVPQVIARVIAFSLWYVPLQGTDRVGEALMTSQVTITSNGRMSLPIAIRRRLGLEDGGAVLVEETADGVVLRTVDQAVARAQAIAKRYAHPGSSVDTFLANRQADSGE
jgi:AbrB family looped-hinge helix DNA binding protein